MRFSDERDLILSQYILHHGEQERQVTFLMKRLERVLERADELHRGQRRSSGEEYIWHPVRTAMEVSRFGRIVDWGCIEAALLHDTLEDTAYTFEEMSREFPEAIDLVDALTKIRDRKELTYEKLFRYALEDIRVLLVKLADRLDNLNTLSALDEPAQRRIARESIDIYANLCRRLCMTEVAERIVDLAAPLIHPERHRRFLARRKIVMKERARTLDRLQESLVRLFPGDLGARWEIKWSRFDHTVMLDDENLFVVRIVTGTNEDAYRALGRIHMAFRAVPRSISDTVSTPLPNNYQALETRVRHEGRVVRFYLAGEGADRFNRLGLLSMDITAPDFHLKYIDDLKSLFSDESLELQDFIGFHRPGTIQVSSPRGEVFNLEEGATALDFAFAVHDGVGLSALRARVNGEDSPLSRTLRQGDWVEILRSEQPVADARYPSWARSRKARTALKRHLNRLERRLAEETGRKWLAEASRSSGLSPEAASGAADAYAGKAGIGVDKMFRRLFLGVISASDILGPVMPSGSRRFPRLNLRNWRGARESVRRVHRFDFSEPHIRFCPRCSPVDGDDIFGVRAGGTLLVHTAKCPVFPKEGRIPLAWEKGGTADDPLPLSMDMQIFVEGDAPVLRAVLEPFKDEFLNVTRIRPLDSQGMILVRLQPQNARALNLLIRELRKIAFVRAIRLFRSVDDLSSPSLSRAEADRPAGHPSTAG